MNNYEIFLNWAKENGATLSDLSLQEYDNSERGVHTNCGIRKGKTIVGIPLKLIIHDGICEKTKYGEIIKKNSRLFKNLKILLVMVYILETNKKDNFYKPYYDILPRNTKNFPIFWSKNDILMLGGSNLINEIITRQDHIMDDYNNMCKIIPEFKQKYSSRDFIWARTVVGSRNFGIDIDNVHRVAMIPISDMLNHDSDPDVKWFFDNKTRQFRMVSNRYLKTKKAVTDTYGMKSNLKYLLFYGFTIKDNTEDVLYINIVHGKQNKQLKDNILSNVNGYLSKNHNSQLFKTMLTFLRISVSDEAILRKHKHVSFYQKPYSFKNEKLTIKALKVYLNTLLKNYTYFNKKSKNTHTKYSIPWNCYNLIMGEISIIQYYLEIVEKSEDSLKQKQDGGSRKSLLFI